MKNWLKVVLRIILVSVYAILVMKLIVFLRPDNIKFTQSITKFLLLYLTLFNLNTEGSLLMDRILNKRLPWFVYPKKRLIVQLSVIIIWSLITIGIPFTIWYFINGRSLVYPPASVIIFIGSIVFLLCFIGVSMIRNFFSQWQNSLLDAEHYKREKIKADYRVLQNQVNPHFLFNSFNVLISEIKHNPDVAVDFTRKLSKVYRYVLQSKNHDLISLKKELDFISSFVFLHKVRVGEAIDFVVDIPQDLLRLQLPPLTLQILVENALKHNELSTDKVLKIFIHANGEDVLVVRNNLQEIRNTESTNTGLSNLKKRFDLLQKDGFKIEKTKEEFIVLIPLLQI